MNCTTHARFGGGRFPLLAAVLLTCCLYEPAVAGVISQTNCGYVSGTAFGGGYPGESWHCTSVEGFGTDTISVSAVAEDESPYSAEGQYAISDSALIDMMVYTAGPVRSGFLELDASSDGEFGEVSEIAGDWTCSSPAFIPCYSASNQFQPVTLGVPFELKIAVSYGQDTGSALASVSFSLFEATADPPSPNLYPGAAVVLLAEAPSAPEPGTYLLFALGGGIIWLKRRPQVEPVQAPR